MREREEGKIWSYLGVGEKERGKNGEYMNGVRSGNKRGWAGVKVEKRVGEDWNVGV